MFKIATVRDVPVRCSSRWMPTLNRLFFISPVPEEAGVPTEKNTSEKLSEQGFFLSDFFWSSLILTF